MKTKKASEFRTWMTEQFGPRPLTDTRAIVRLISQKEAAEQEVARCRDVLMDHDLYEQWERAALYAWNAREKILQDRQKEGEPPPGYVKLHLLVMRKKPGTAPAPDILYPLGCGSGLAAYESISDAQDAARAISKSDKAYIGSRCSTLTTSYVIVPRDLANQLRGLFLVPRTSKKKRGSK